MPVAVSPVDAFDLPEWVGVRPVTWRAETSLGSTWHVTGVLDADGSAPLGCDLLAGDLAFPAPVLDDKWRSQAHQAWSLGEALLVEYAGRLTVVLPGTTVTADSALEAVRRLARAVGAPSDRFTVALRL